MAVVEDGLEDRRRLYRAMGEPAIGFGITKLRGANAVQVGRDVRARLAEIEKQLPEGLFLAVNFDTTVFVERAINEILFTLILAALLTSVVCWVFLGSWSTTLNVLLAIPTSILGTFIVMYVFGFTLNTYTVLGLTLVVGIVVDDAIMVLENIYRHREQGAGKVTAASVGAREITFAAAAATLAIMAIFLPVAFMKGMNTRSVPRRIAMRDCDPVGHAREDLPDLGGDDLGAARLLQVVEDFAQAEDAYGNRHEIKPALKFDDAEIKAALA